MLKYCLFKKNMVLSLVFLVPSVLFAQQKTDPAKQNTPQKYALVIGNGSYKNLSKLENPVNDANDITAVLKHLGFSVDKGLNGNLNQMERAVEKLKENLESADKAYGFFFYAGHGVQSGGDNYLIPVDANIPSENYLRTRAVSVQQVLDELNDAGNGLNVVVLDACRDNPFGWSRSGSRGLAMVSSQPADSIVVYATSAGQRASDGEGRNGLFTSQLISNLATPGLEVTEVFRRTGADVAKVSGNQQIPAIYSQFFGTAYLGEVSLDEKGNIIQAPSATVILKKEDEPEPAKYWTIGASVGSSFIDPWVIGTARGTLAPFKYSFLELGLDLGLVSGKPDVGYYSLCPFVHIAYYQPIGERFGLYAGGGGGYFWGKYRFPEADITKSIVAFDAVAGINILDMFDFSYTLRTDFKNISNKISFGYTYRFK
jgi:hypothetical protein